MRSSIDGTAGDGSNGWIDWGAWGEAGYTADYYDAWGGAWGYLKFTAFNQTIAANGVLLPRAIHDGLANDQTYMRAVFEELSKASTRQQGMDILRDIGERLLNGTFPR